MSFRAARKAVKTCVLLDGTEMSDEMFRGWSVYWNRDPSHDTIGLRLLTCQVFSAKLPPLCLEDWRYAIQS